MAMIPLEVKIMQTSDQVIVIQGDATKWYSQAVFIMNPNPLAEHPPVDFVAEAEKIIFSYMARKQKFAKSSAHAYLDYTQPAIIKANDNIPILIEEPQRKRFWQTPLFYIATFGMCLAMAAILALGWLR